MYAFLNRRVLCEYRRKLVLVLGDEQCFFVDEADEAGSSARGLLDEADGGVVDGDVRGAARLAEMCGNLRGEVEGGFIRFLSICAKNDVRAGDVADVQPDVRGGGGLKCECVVLDIVLADKNDAAIVGGKENGCARRSLLRFSSFSWR